MQAYRKREHVTYLEAFIRPLLGTYVTHKRSYICIRIAEESCQTSTHIHATQSRDELSNTLEISVVLGIQYRTWLPLQQVTYLIKSDKYKIISFCYHTFIWVIILYWFRNVFQHLRGRGVKVIFLLSVFFYNFWSPFVNKVTK